MQLRYVDSRNQLADMLIKGSFTRDQWNPLLRLMDIMKFSMVSCSHVFLSDREQSEMSNRGQECNSEESSAMTTPASMNFVMAKP